MLILPHAIQEEAYLLAAIIRDALPLPDNLIPSDFYEPKHQEIASAIKHLTEQGTEPNELTITERLRNVKSIADHVYLSQLSYDLGISSYRSTWSREIKKKASLRAMVLFAEKLRDIASDPACDPESLIAYTEGSIKSIGSRSSKSGPIHMDLESMEAFERTNDPNVVLGRRWLCKGGSLLMVGQSGTGKSSLMMQAAIQWCVGRNFFGITTKKALRAVILQAENDFGDVAEAYQDCVGGANLTATERKTLKENLYIYRDTISVGAAFPRMLRELITKHQADIVFVDPLLSFAGIDISNQEQASQFLRHGIAPILLDTGAILVAMHHTGKPKSAKDKEGLTIADMAYAGLGSSEFTNYFREVAVLARMPGEEPIYKFGLTKRRGRAYLTDLNGDFQGEITIRHSKTPNTIRWEYASPSDQTQAPATKPSLPHSDYKARKPKPRRD